MSKSKKEDSIKERCPQCGKRDFVGFLGGSSCKKYFCSECCIEFTVNKDGLVTTQHITLNGTLE
jgi:transposase-like protein